MTDHNHQPRWREAARAVVLDPDNNILLVRFEFPNGATRWALPGGGLESGESHVDGLRRELAEELGLVDPVVGPHVWNRTHIVPFIDGQFDGQRERIHLVRCAAFTPQPQLTWEQMNAEYVFELRWWTIDDIADSDEHFVPGDLARLARQLVTGGAPELPIDVGP